MSELKDEIGEFLQEIYPLLYKETPGSTASMLQVSEHKHVICQLLTEVIEWAKKLVEAGHLYKVRGCSYPWPTRFTFFSFQVLRTVRTGITYQGKRAVAICLDDLFHVCSEGW